MRGAVLIMLGAVLAASPARAAETAEPSEAGFGKRAHFLFTIDNVVGATRDFPGSGVTFLGAFPGLFGPRVGFHNVTNDGVTFGTNLGFTVLGGGRGDTLMALTISPRVGYATSASPTIGFWLRGGPTFHFFSSGSATYLVGAGAEALLVVTPVDHFGVLIGPNAEASPIGSQSATYYQLGFSVGWVADL